MRYLSKRNVAEQLDVSVRTIDRYIAKRIIKSRTLVTGKVRIPVAEIEKLFKPDIQQFLNNE
jgi:predicted site-specific integrase-resolvase